MFKSLFAKYVTTFMAIILVSFLIIILILSSFIGIYAEETKTDIMRRSAANSVSYLEETLGGRGEGDLSLLMAEKGSDVEAMLSVVSSYTEDLTVLLVDREGRVLVAVGTNASEIGRDTLLPGKLLQGVGDGAFLSEDTEGYEPLADFHCLYGRAVSNDAGETVGTVLVCASSLRMGALREVVGRAIVMMGLLVLVATLIAIYLITDRIVRPLREISRAAKCFASGNFDVRVPVRGRDDIAELAVAFNNMAESLSKYDTMRNTLISGVSHDLRTPMTTISGFVDGILDGVIPEEKHEYYLTIVSGEIKRLSRLVSTLLDISRIQAGERKFVESRFDVSEMARQILLSFEQTLEEKKLAVSFETEEDALFAVADRDAIHQVLYNLCDNGVKFAAEGGAFRIALRREKNQKILVSVYNEGQGIADGDLPFVFERFYKSDKSRGINKSGTGLGLFIAKTIVEAHKESIWVESEYGQSCCFYFTLRSE